MKRHGYSGGFLLVVMLVALAMSSLSLSHMAYAERFREMSAKANRSISDWNAACVEADGILASVRRGEHPDGVVLDGDVVSYSVPVSDVLELRVEATVRSKNDYEVTRWQSVPVTTWTPDESVRVWDGN